MHSDSPERTQAIVGSMNLGLIYDTARNRTHNRFRHKLEPIMDGRPGNYTGWITCFKKKTSFASGPAC